MLIGSKADLWSSDSWDVDPADLEVTDNADADGIFRGFQLY